MLWNPKGTDGLKLEGQGEKKYKKTFTASGTSDPNL